MFEYDFVEIQFNMFSKAKQDYRAIIAEKAALGWRLAHFTRLPSQESGNGEALEMIFERPYQGPQDATRADGPEWLTPAKPAELH